MMSKLIVAALAALLLAGGPALALEPLSGVQIKQMLSDRTFQVRYQGGSTYLIYFSPAGKVKGLLAQEGFITKVVKTGSWDIREQDALCVKYIRRSTTHRRLKMKCGKIVPQGNNVFNRYDEQGKLHAIFTFVGQGNRVPE
ncbi:MAG: hypothetical protein ABFR97_06565 [Thermodesulfobacteriota bacterium]